jgi:hypothetical protein
MRTLGGIAIDEAGVSIVHPLMRDPLSIDVDDVLTVTAPASLRDEVFGRDPRILPLSTDRHANIAIVVRAPIATGPFGYGADRVLGLRRRERRHGIDVDVITGCVEDPSQLLRDAADQSIDVGLDLRTALVRTLGSVDPDEATRRRDARRRLARRVRMRAFAVIALITALHIVRIVIAARPDVPDFEGQGVGPHITVPLTPNTTVPDPERASTPPEGAYALATGTESLIDLATAERVFAALHPLRTDAVFYHDGETLEHVETGAALVADRARCVATDCRTPPLAIAARAQSFSAPPQSEFPAYFVASVQVAGTRGQGVTEVFVITRRSRHDPWLISLAVGSETEAAIFDASGSDLNTTPTDMTDLEPKELLGLLAENLETSARTTLIQTDPIFGSALDDAIKRIADADSADGVEDLRRRRQFRVDPEIVYVVAANGGSLTCGVLHVHEAVTTRAIGRTFETTSDGRWSTLEPGRYREVDVEVIDQVCIRLGPDGLASAFWAPPSTVAIDGEPA